MKRSDGASIGAGTGTTASTAIEERTSAVDAGANGAPVVARLLRQRNEARAQAQTLARDNQCLEAFLGLASHELRCPATSSSLAVQVAARHLDVLRNHLAWQGRDGALAGEFAAVHEALMTAESSLERLTRLMGGLLDLSRIKAGQRGQLTGRPAPADLLAIVRAAVDEQRQIAPTRCIRLRPPSTHQEIPVWACADLIHQVMTNYLTNALKYAPDDLPVDVRMRVRTGWVRASVQDQGSGLAAGDQVHIWEPFHRVDGVKVASEGPHSSAQSLGLGLYICRTIIEQHHGRVGVRSQPGKGATFWFDLPVMRMDRLALDEQLPLALDAA